MPKFHSNVSVFLTPKRYLTKWGVILDWFIFMLLLLAHFNYPMAAHFCGRGTSRHQTAVKYYHLMVEAMQFIIVSADVCIIVMYRPRWIQQFQKQ